MTIRVALCRIDQWRARLLLPVGQRTAGGVHDLKGPDNTLRIGRPEPRGHHRIAVDEFRVKLG